jgi:hypothetical protein
MQKTFKKHLESIKNIQNPLESLSDLVQVLDEEERATARVFHKRRKIQTTQFFQHPT